MGCSFDIRFDCYDGYNYAYGTCCDASWVLFWNILMYVSLCLCVMFCCCMMMSAMRRRRRQLAGASRRNHDGLRVDSTSSEESFVEPRRNNNTRRADPYNAPIGGAQAAPYYAAPPQAVQTYPPLPDGIRPIVNQKKPKTNIRINLYTGQSVTLEVNMDHTVADLHTYVMSVAPIAGSYQLMSGYPMKPLADPSKTIKAAGLKQANVTMTLV